ncbi:hypothetical protein [Salmonella phage wksl3]|uniref:Uncharacterized protein n=1 Tax=Salmonella phage wksl3 TaxID=1204541 RepID=I7A2U2_9CAUD|nr:hypothetical protein FDI19_gp49 [Salmonella phage wksl3]AFO12385.1 hypothetical protein [Salmonella phage wksl3]
MTNKYNRTMTNTDGDSITCDVYDVLRAFDIRDPALQHCVEETVVYGLAGAQGHRNRLSRSN